MTQITTGDIVDVIWNDDSAPILGARVVHTPGGEGDLWQVEKDGKLYAINGSGRSFDCFIKKQSEQAGLSEKL